MIGWLKDVIGFTERVVYRNGDTVQHAELAYGPSLLMLGQCRDDEYGKLVGDIGGRRTDALYVAVDDPDALHAGSRHQAPGSRWSCTTRIMAAATSPAGIRKAISGVLAPSGRRRTRSR